MLHYFITCIYGTNKNNLSCKTYKRGLNTISNFPWCRILSLFPKFTFGDKSLIVSLLYKWGIRRAKYNNSYELFCWYIINIHLRTPYLFVCNQENMTELFNNITPGSMSMLNCEIYQRGRVSRIAHLIQPPGSIPGVGWVSRNHAVIHIFFLYFSYIIHIYNWLMMNITFTVPRKVYQKIHKQT